MNGSAISRAEREAGSNPGRQSYAALNSHSSPAAGSNIPRRSSPLPTWRELFRGMQVPYLSHYHNCPRPAYVARPPPAFADLDTAAFDPDAAAPHSYDEPHLEFHQRAGWAVEYHGDQACTRQRGRAAHRASGAEFTTRRQHGADGGCTGGASPDVPRYAHRAAGHELDQGGDYSLSYQPAPPLCPPPRSSSWYCSSCGCEAGLSRLSEHAATFSACFSSPPSAYYLRPKRPTGGLAEPRRIGIDSPSTQHAHAAGTTLDAHRVSNPRDKTLTRYYPGAVPVWLRETSANPIRPDGDTRDRSQGRRIKRQIENAE